MYSRMSKWSASICGVYEVFYIFGYLLDRYKLFLIRIFKSNLCVEFDCFPIDFLIKCFKENII
jgi:hypothetical protein